MKVLQINAINYVSSTGRNCFELNEYLNKNGHICITAFSKGPFVDPEHEYRIGNNLDVKLHGLLSRVTGKQGYFSKKATKKLLCFANEFKPDIVVLNNLHANFINLPLLLSYLSENDIPTVVVLHDCWFYTGKCCHYTIDACYKWKENCGKCKSLKKYNKSWFFDKTKVMLQDKKKLFGAIPRLAVVGVSDWLINEAKQAPVFQNAKIFKRIYNWIDTEVFKPKDTSFIKEKLGISNKKIFLSVASKWNKEKGLFTLISFAKKLKENEKLIIVGNLAENVKLPASVLNIPTTSSSEELAEYYSLADVFIQPSLEETFGKVSAETLACGTPVVCFNSTANPELVGENCGAIIETGNVTDLLEKARIICHKDKEEFKKSCRLFAENHFSKQAQLEIYTKLFKEISNENK